MLDLRHVVEHLDDVRAGLARRSPAAAETIAPIADLGQKRRELIAAVEAKQALRNLANEKMAKADKKSAEFAEQREALKTLSGEIKEAEKQLNDVLAAIGNILSVVPNIPDASVPDGKGEDDNVVVRTWGTNRRIRLRPKPIGTLVRRSGSSISNVRRKCRALVLPC